MTAAIELVIKFSTSAPSVQVDFGLQNGGVDTQRIYGVDRKAFSNNLRHQNHAEIKGDFRKFEILIMG